MKSNMNDTEIFTPLNEGSTLAPEIINMFEKEHNSFDYDSVRKFYFEELELINKTKILSRKQVWNRFLLYNKILEIKMTSTSHSRYEVISFEGEDWLVRRRLKPDFLIERIIPSEYCFDIIVKAHIETGHGDAKATADAIYSKYIYPKFCIPIILKYCNVCSTASVSFNKNKSKTCWYISIVESPDKNETFKYILIYIEKNSEYTLLRPLMSKCVDEVSLELFKIFCVFGTPNKLFTPKDLFTFVKIVSNKVLMLSPCFKFHVFTVRNNLYLFKRSIKYVLKALNSWITETGCDKWELGCHIVQWKINTTRKVITSFNVTRDFVIDLPYDYFFGHQVNVFNYVNGNEVPVLERNTKQNQNDIAVDKGNSSSSNDQNPELLDIEESTIVDSKKVYANCFECNENLVVQYKCCFCQRPIHSECGTIMRNYFKRKYVYFVKCKECK